MKPFTVMHTSDWHLGHQLHHRRREEEFRAFLAWLATTIQREDIDALVVAGDIFDSSVPSPATQKMYYDFLLACAKAGIQHIVATAGNHDSPTLLSAAAPLLAQLRIHVIGAISDNCANEIITLKNQANEPQLFVCAAPHIRERDIRLSMPGETLEEKEKLLKESIRTYYQAIGQLVEEKRGGLDVPALAMGHLFVGGATPASEEANSYIGTLGQISADIFPDAFDYVALGHIHRPQRVAGSQTIRYCGSPLPMSFSEAGQEKQVLVIRFHGRTPEISPIAVPQFRQLRNIHGCKRAILEELANLRALSDQDEKTIWVEIHHDGTDDPFDLQKLVNSQIADSRLQVLCIKTDYQAPGLPALQWQESLEELRPEDIFKMRLDQEKLTEEDRSGLMESCLELMREMQENGEDSL